MSWLAGFGAGSRYRSRMARTGSAAAAGSSGLIRHVRRIPRVMWTLLTQTLGTCLRYRVTGLAAEGAFFAILSLPPLIFGLAGSIGYLANQFDVETIDEMKEQIIELAGQALTADSVRAVIVPTLNDVLNGGGRLEVVSIGFVIALWSGSRALNVFVDTITIMYGLGGRRGIVRTRMLSFTLYCVALLIGVIVLPLVLAGPKAVNNVLPERLDVLNQLYWPVVIVLSAGFLNTLYHLAVPVRTPWISDLPGSALALSLWILGSFLLRWTLQTTVGGTSIYGPLAAPIAVLLWLYLTAIAVLIGAALNATMDRLWPHHRPRAKVADQAGAAGQDRAKATRPTRMETESGAEGNKKMAAAKQPGKQPEKELETQQDKQQDKQPDAATTADAGAQDGKAESDGRPGRGKSRARPKSGNVA